ncbi:hypothetical protein [Mycobacteroides abscessus]|uniref:hypothetical protein n=1 Tax=Mycobacteroides abscessus TaxID=36809 RepID=UPI0009419075|nr:hypothetical protein [Mycobacteroides abscessus]
MKSQRRKCPGLQRDLLELVHQYAQAYAESIIGQDDSTGQDGYSAVGYPVQRNDLRTEQRTLNNEKKGKL